MDIVDQPHGVHVPAADGGKIVLHEPSERSRPPGVCGQGRLNPRSFQPCELKPTNELNFRLMARRSLALRRRRQGRLPGDGGFAPRPPPSFDDAPAQSKIALDGTQRVGLSLRVGEHVPEPVSVQWAPDDLQNLARCVRKLGQPPGGVLDVLAPGGTPERADFLGGVVPFGLAIPQVDAERGSQTLDEPLSIGVGRKRRRVGQFLNFRGELGRDLVGRHDVAPLSRCPRRCKRDDLGALARHRSLDPPADRFRRRAHRVGRKMRIALGRRGVAMA